jgi:hypothetical protein
LVSTPVSLAFLMEIDFIRRVVPVGT